jgi:hypothetical protein
MCPRPRRKVVLRNLGSGSILSLGTLFLARARLLWQEPVVIADIDCPRSRVFFRLRISDLGRREVLSMSFPWLHQKISLRASTGAICLAVAITIVCLQVCLSAYELKINGDTPAICRLYLEQNPMVHDHFGELQEELFLKDESAVLINDPNSGAQGLYTFRIRGTIAKGTVKMVWAREVGDGALTVTAIRITDEHPLSHPLTGHDLKEVAPQVSGLPSGPIATAF